MTMRLDRVVRALLSDPWAITPEYMSLVSGVIRRRLEGRALNEAEIAAIVAARPTPFESRGSVAVLPVFGVISHRMNLMTEVSGGTSTERLTGQFRQAMSDPNVSTIVFDIDSPGGGVAGVPELAAEIRAATQKRTIAVANDLAASAAFWIASAADEIVMTPSGMVGSIGVVAAHQDFSEFDAKVGVKTTLVSAGEGKIDGNSLEPLSERALADMKAKIETFYGLFVDGVVKGRNAAGQHLTGATVRDRWQAKLFTAADALDAGLVDRVATLDQTLDRVAGRTRRSSVAMTDTVMPTAELHDGPVPNDDELVNRLNKNRADREADDEARKRRARRLAVGV